MLAPPMALRGIKVKLTVAIGVAVVATAVALKVVTNLLVSLPFDLSTKERAAETGKIVNQGLATQTRLISGSIQVLTQDPQFQQDFSFQSWDHIRDSLT